MKNILIIGDSHIKHFTKYDSHYNFDVLRFSGASAQGLLNVNSTKKTLLRILKFFKRNTKTYDYVVLCFGEVDCNATIWYYKEKYNQTLQEALNRTIDRYFEFIKTYIEQHFNANQIILFGPTLPTIADGVPQKFELRQQISATQRERTELTDLFSLRLNEIAEKNKYNFLSVNEVIRDKKTNLVDTKWVKKPKDHHLPKNVSFELWVRELDTLLCNNI